MPHLDTSSSSNSSPRSWATPLQPQRSPPPPSPRVYERATRGIEYIELDRQNSRYSQRRPSMRATGELSPPTPRSANGAEPPRRPPLRYASKDSTGSLVSPQNSYISTRRNALGSPGSQMVPVLESQDVLSPLGSDSVAPLRRRGSMPSPERDPGLRTPLQLRPLQLVNTLAPVPPTPMIDPRSPVNLACSCPQHPTGAVPLQEPAALLPMSEEARAAYELYTGKRASFWPAMHILSIPTLGLGGKLIIAAGLSRIVVAHALNEEDSAESLKWWGVLGVGCFSLVYSIFAGSFHVNHFSPTAAWSLGAASLVSATVFSVGEWMTVQAQITKQSALFNGGGVVAGVGLCAASLCNFTYFTHGELHHGFVPIPRRVLTSSMFGAMVTVSLAVYALTSVNRRDGLVARDTVVSSLLLLSLLVLMLNFSYGMRAYLKLGAHRDVEQQLALSASEAPRTPAAITTPREVSHFTHPEQRTVAASPPSYFAFVPPR